jgi:hypothetical protein
VSSIRRIGAELVAIGLSLGGADMHERVGHRLEQPFGREIDASFEPRPG